MKKYLKLIRIKHWLKNILVFLPLFFSGNLINYDKLKLCVISFFVFSLISSIVYIFNDIKDIEDDKKHEIKKKRPLASGEVTIKKAIYILIVLIMLNIVLMTVLFIKNKDIFTILVPLIYIILNIIYSISFKHKPIIDVVILVSGFLLRVVYGGIVINVEVSNWLYLLIIFGSFYLGFGKRRNEIIKNGQNSRKVLKYYNKEFLDKNMYVNLTLALVSYSMWCVDPITIARIGNNLLFWTIPVVVIIFQLYSLNIEQDSYGDPIEVILSDKMLLFMILMYGLMMFLILYTV